MERKGEAIIRSLAQVVDLPPMGVERSVAQCAIEAMRGKTINNLATGIGARLSSSAKGKLISNKATGKSKENGFSREQHNAIVARIDEIYRLSTLISSRPDREGDANILSIKRFATKVRFGNQLAVAWITVKESKQFGHHIYSVEAIKLEALDRKVEVVSGNTPHASSAPTRNMIASFFARVKMAFLSLFAVAALLVFAPARAAAETKSVWDLVEEGAITWEGASTNWVGGDLVLEWAIESGGGIGTFTLPGFAKCWILEVGGGGGGGTGADGMMVGAGAGGGAGGFVENKSLMLSAGTYNVVVGRGGESFMAAAVKPGMSGGNSSITSAASNLPILDIAYGGGGVGANSLTTASGVGGDLDNVVAFNICTEQSVLCEIIEAGGVRKIGYLPGVKTRRAIFLVQ